MEAAAPTAMALEQTERVAVLEELVASYGNGVLHLAYLYVKDRDMAEDIFQEVFTRVYTQWDRFRGESSPKTWIYRITINLCRDKLRSWSVRRVLLLGEEMLGAHTSPQADAEAEAFAVMDKTVLLEAVMELPIEYREVVLLYYYEEMDTREVAFSLALSEGTVRSRLFRARGRLKTVLMEGGFADGRA